MGSWKNITKLSLFLTFAFFVWAVFVEGAGLPLSIFDASLLAISFFLIWGMIHISIFALFIPIAFLPHLFPGLVPIIVWIAEKLEIDE